MPDENPKKPSQGNALQPTGQKTALRAGGWILTLVVVALWVGGRQIWNGRELIQPIAEAQYTVEINQASERDLLNLPEVGPSLARNILSYREQNGDFHSLSEFGDVPGVGPQTLKQLAPFLSFAHSSKAATGDTTSDTTTSDATEETILTAQSRERIAP